MNQTELLDLHAKLCNEGRELMAKKNSDYGANTDAFANFRMRQLLHIEPALGAMLRMQDKMARIISFLEKGTLAVKEEGWHDCIVDLINYSVILHGLLAELASKIEKSEAETIPSVKTIDLVKELLLFPVMSVKLEEMSRNPDLDPIQFLQAIRQEVLRRMVKPGGSFDSGSNRAG